LVDSFRGSRWNYVYSFFIFRTGAKKSEEEGYESSVIPIIEKVNLEPYTDEEKESIKSILKALNSRVVSEPLSRILNDLQQEHNDHFKLALPYVQQYIKQFIGLYT
jgi:hypothetical protein